MNVDCFCPAAKRSKQRKGPKAVRVDVDEDLMDDMGGTPTPMNANRAQQAYAGAARDKRKRKVGVGSKLSVKMACNHPFLHASIVVKFHRQL